MKLTDRIALISILFLLFLLWTTYLSKNLAVALAVSAVLCIVIGILIHPRKRAQKIKPEEYLPKLSIMTAIEQSEMILKVLSQDIHPKIIKNGLICADGGLLIIPSIRMRELSADEICRLSECAKRLNYKRLIIVTGARDKIGFEKIKPYLPVPTEFLEIAQILTSLEKQSSLPEIERAQKPKAQKFTVLFKNATKRKNGKYFLLTALSTAFLSIFTPLTLYYLIFATISFVLSILCFTKRRESVPSIII